MKILIIIVVTFVVALALGWFIWGKHTGTPPPVAAFTPAAHAPATNAVPPLPARPAPVASNLPLPSEWQELRSVRAATLQNNPDLAAEYKSLLDQLDEQDKALDAAMIKADPKVAPIVAKLEELRKKNSVAHNP